MRYPSGKQRELIFFQNLSTKSANPLLPLLPQIDNLDLAQTVLADTNRNSKDSGQQGRQ